MSLTVQRTSAAVSLLLLVAACGGGGGGGSSSGGASGSSPSAGSSSSVTSSASSSAASASSSSTSSLITSSATCPAATVSGTDALTLTGASTPLQLDTYGTRRPGLLATIDGKHNPSNYKVAPVLPTWQFATSDPTAGSLSDLECAVAPDAGWHSYKRASGTSATITHSKVVVTGGRNATADHIYTVYNGQQLVAALQAAGLAPKIIRVVGHIDLRMSNNNTTFTEYDSYTDQKYGGSINIPSNTTLVGINDATGKPARVTGTTILIGGELAQSAGGDPEADFKAWIAAGKDGDNYPTWTRNVIIRNLKIDTPWDVNPEDSGNAYADGVTISRAQNIWVDHVSITDGDTPDTLASDTRHDGALDVVRGSDYVTISSSFFGDHGKNTLVGNGDSGRAWSDQGRLHVTFTGLWWSGIASRHPLIRFGQLHTFNNLMEGTTLSGGYGHNFEGGLDVRYQSSVFSENNFHYFTGLKHKEVCGKLSGGSSGKEFRVTGSQFISDKDDNGKPWATSYTGAINVDSELSAANCTQVPAADITWAAPYSYTALDANAARVEIEKHTGAGRIGNSATTGTARDISSGVSTSSSSSAASSTTSSTSTSAASSSVASSASSSSAGATPVCTALFTCDTSVGAQTMNAAVTATGSDSFSAGVYTVSGAGNVSATATYNHYFKYMPLTGDFIMTAKLVTQGGSADGARAGLLATDSLSGSGAFAWTARYASSGDIRAMINGNNKSSIAGYSTSALPIWVRIERRGNALYSAASTNGTTWTEKTNLTVTAATLYAGFAVSSGNNASTVTATFENVTVTGGGLP